MLNLNVPTVPLTCFYELSHQASMNSTCLLFGVLLPHAIYLKATQSTFAQCDISVMHYSTNHHMQQRHVRQPTHYLPRN